MVGDLGFRDWNRLSYGVYSYGYTVRFRLGIGLSFLYAMPQKIAARLYLDRYPTCNMQLFALYEFFVVFSYFYDS